METVVNITCTYSYCGYPQAESHYTLETNYITLKVEKYGNQGIDLPQIEEIKKSKCNGYFWELQAITKQLFNGGDITRAMLGMRTRETKQVTIKI